ncbi:hypothetical protein P43SY_008839 [Pythium insidiosum]|uniref:Mannosyltransferase n=1 Tax=Pythium insidiosum TaxID=114742 RepID=A0AAD5QDN2_PYTIN|nr:hypothetical protein P43SY_008839 [Pythium insidiosum]
MSMTTAVGSTLERWAQARWFWAAMLLFRVWNALFVRTAFNPDEYWQSTEVAHRMVFGYGHLTWEWQDDARLRGFAHPAVFALLYKLLAIGGLDTRWAIAYGPRVLQGTLAVFNDYSLYHLGRVYFDRRVATWALFCHIFSWFIFYVLVRPYSNSIETICTTAALAHWPWQFLSSDRRRLLLQYVLPIATITILLMLAIDFLGYGALTFVPLNFIKFNVLEVSAVHSSSRSHSGKE